MYPCLLPSPTPEATSYWSKLPFAVDGWIFYNRTMWIYLLWSKFCTSEQHVFNLTLRCFVHLQNTVLTVSNRGTTEINLERNVSSRDAERYFNSYPGHSEWRLVCPKSRSVTRGLVSSSSMGSSEEVRVSLVEEKLGEEKIAQGCIQVL